MLIALLMTEYIIMLWFTKCQNHMCVVFSKLIWYLKIECVYQPYGCSNYAGIIMSIMIDYNYIPQLCWHFERNLKHDLTFLDIQQKKIDIL